jgi:hypothetical protein
MSYRLRHVKRVTTQIHMQALDGQAEHVPDETCWCKPVVTIFRSPREDAQMITTVIDHWGGASAAVTRAVLVDLLPPSTTRPTRFVPGNPKGAATSRD